MKKRFHFIGINGVGMSPLALILLQQGYAVSGSDIKVTDITEKLISYGAKFYSQHDANNVISANCVIYSSAIDENNCEIKMAKELGIEVLHRSQLLGYITRKVKSICVAGTHGKTTTSAMISFVLENCGLDPTIMVGGNIKGMNLNAKYGTGKYGVFETCEADKSILQAKASYGVITNIDDDHLEFYNNDFNQIKNSFFSFAENIALNGVLVTPSNNPYLQDIIKEASCNIITVGIRNSQNNYDYNKIKPYYEAVIKSLDLKGSQVEVYRANKYLGVLQLNIPGEHNIINSLFALAICEALGLEFSEISYYLKKFEGVDKRFQILKSGDILVIEDNGHHPTAIRYAISTAKLAKRNLIVLFQPQRVSRLHYYFNDFADVLSEVNTLILYEAYTPSDENFYTDKNTMHLYNFIKSNFNTNVSYFNDTNKATTFIESILKSGDVLLSIGIAGDTSKIVNQISKNILSRSR